MSDVFISYAHSTEPQAHQVEQALRALGYGVWRDNALPAHRAFSEVLEDKLREAKAVVVLWSAEAVKSDWVRAEANRAREARKLVQLSIDGVALPLPFDQTQCADMNGWSGEVDAPGWLKVLASVADLVGGEPRDSPLTDVSLPMPSKPSIAVMPFANLSGDPEQAYFAEGMVEEIVGALSRYKSIFVIGIGSTRSLKDKATSPPEVGRQLGVRYVLEGSVRRAADRIRIAVKLTDCADGAQIWADRFEDTLEDVFALQDRVALSVAGVIEPAVQNAEARRVLKRPTENMGSYDLYLRAKTVSIASDLTEISVKLDLLHRAIDLDPGFGPALAMAASWHAILSLRSSSSDRAAHREQSIALMQRALEVAGDDPAVLGTVALASLIIGRERNSIEPLIERALILNPGSAASWSNSAQFQVAMGEPDLAAQHIETALRLDPLSSSRFELLAYLGAARLLQRRFDEAITLCRQSLELQPTFAPARAWLASALGHVGRIREARQALAGFHAVGVGTIESFAERRFRTSEGRELFLDGVAKAAAGAAPDASAG